MSREYNPDKWVLIKIGDMQKVLGGWSGGYLDSDNWRLSSRVETIELEGDYYLFKNYSGSIYKCHRNGQGFTSLSSSIYSQIEKKCEEADKTVELIEVDSNYTINNGDNNE